MEKTVCIGLMGYGNVGRIIAHYLFTWPEERARHCRLLYIGTLHDYGNREIEGYDSHEENKEKIIKICKISDSAINLRIPPWNSDGAQKPSVFDIAKSVRRFFHSKFLRRQKSKISERSQSLMTLKSQKASIHLRIKKRSLLVFPDNPADIYNQCFGRYYQKS